MKSPSAYAPTVNLGRAIARRAVVLQSMVDAGVLSAEEASRARQERVMLHDGLARDDPRGAWFKEEVRRELVARFGLARVYEGGLIVHTTIDLAMQRAAEDLTTRALDDIEKRRARQSRIDADVEAPLQGAMIALDPSNGEVRALVGGRDFDRELLQSGHPGAPPAGLGLQAVCLRDCARAGLGASVDHRPARRAHPDPAGRVDARGRASRLTRADAADRPAHLEQPGGRPPAAGSRRRQGRRDGAAAWTGPGAKRPVARPRIG